MSRWRSAPWPLRSRPARAAAVRCGACGARRCLSRSTSASCDRLGRLKELMRLRFHAIYMLCRLVLRGISALGALQKPQALAHLGRSPEAGSPPVRWSPVARSSRAQAGLSSSRAKLPDGIREAFGKLATCLAGTRKPRRPRRIGGAC